MPGPGNKRKANANARRNVVAKESRRLDVEDPSPSQCLTLDEHGIARCARFPTDGDVKPNRCRVHYEQYRMLCKKYTHASVIIDGIRKCGAELPTKGQVDQYTDWHAALEKVCWIRNYLDMMWVERTGREIHRRQFFLQVDDAYHRRLKLLRVEMMEAVDVLDALQGKAYQLYLSNGNLHIMNARGLPTAEAELEKQSKRTAKEILECICNPIVFCNWPRMMPLFIFTPTSVEDEDLIDMSLRQAKQRMLRPLEPFFEFESFKDTFADILGSRLTTESGMAMFEKMFFVLQQFARRIIFHEPALFMKSLEKESIKDLVCDEFSMEDLARFLSLFMNPLVFPLRLFKDAVLDVLAVSHHDTAADLENRFQLLGGSVFARSHGASMSDEAWWLLLKALQTSANVENCFIRLCNNFDDLVALLSFTAFGLVPSPSFCQRPSRSELDDPSLSRNHLSLSGIIVADMVGMSIPQHLCGPVPTTLRAKKPNCIVWCEIEPRAFMFGAIRNEQDPFVDAFLQELRARPDLFQVVLRSETAPGRHVEMFGSGPSNDQALPALRTREFEAPPSYPPSVPPSTGDKWGVDWSATDVLFRSGQEPEMKGYLTPKRGLDGYFRFKTFPVTYFVILDTVPYRDSTALARNVAWAALRAGGYAEGEYTLNKYAAAADALLERCAQERLGWLPKEMEWKLPRMRDRMGWCTVM